MLENTRNAPKNIALKTVTEQWLLHFLVFVLATKNKKNKPVSRGGRRAVGPLGAQRGAVCVHVKYVRSLVTSCLELQTRNLN